MYDWFSPAERPLRRRSESGMALPVVDFLVLLLEEADFFGLGVVPAFLALLMGLGSLGWPDEADLDLDWVRAFLEGWLGSPRSSTDLRF
jgi:hypothetical protein